MEARQKIEAAAAMAPAMKDRTAITVVRASGSFAHLPGQLGGMTVRYYLEGFVFGVLAILVIELIKAL